MSEYNLATIRFESFKEGCSEDYSNYTIKGSVSDFMKRTIEENDDGRYILMFSMAITKKEYDNINGWVEEG